MSKSLKSKFKFFPPIFVIFDKNKYVGYFVLASQIFEKLECIFRIYLKVFSTPIFFFLLTFNAFECSFFQFYPYNSSAPIVGI